MQADRHIPPHDLDAEQGVLGGVLNFPDNLAGLGLEAADFYDRRHGRIFAAMLALAEADRAVDEITVASYLRDESYLEGIGGAAYLAELSDIIASPAHVATYAETVLRTSRLRQMITTLHEGLGGLWGAHTDPLEAAGEISEGLLKATSRLGSGRDPSHEEAVTAAMNAAADRAERVETVKALPTGWGTLDGFISGLYPGKLVVLAARPSMGKTAMALNIAAHWSIRLNRPGLFVSVEQDQDEMINRLICSAARLDSGLWEHSDRMNQEHWSRVTGIEPHVRRAPMHWLCDAFTLAQVTPRARALKQRGQLDWIVVDYLQLMDGPGDGREDQVSNLSRGFKRLAKSLEVPVLLLSQLNRKCEERNPPTPRLSDLRDSGSIEQDADMVWFIYRPAKVAADRGVKDRDILGDRTADVLIAKNRNGPTGRRSLVYQESYMRFEELGVG